MRYYPDNDGYLLFLWKSWKISVWGLDWRSKKVLERRKKSNYAHNIVGSSFDLSHSSDGLLSVAAKFYFDEWFNKILDESHDRETHIHTQFYLVASKVNEKEEKIIKGSKGKRSEDFGWAHCCERCHKLPLGFNSSFYPWSWWCCCSYSSLGWFTVVFHPSWHIIICILFCFLFIYCWLYLLLFWILLLVKVVGNIFCGIVLTIF